MHPNLKAEMARHDIKCKDIADILEMNRSTITEKMRRKGGFTTEQAQKIRDEFFIGFDIEYLFLHEISYAVRREVR